MRGRAILIGAGLLLWGVCTGCSRPGTTSVRPGVMWETGPTETTPRAATAAATPLPELLPATLPAPAPAGRVQARVPEPPRTYYLQPLPPAISEQPNPVPEAVAPARAAVPLERTVGITEISGGPLTAVPLAQPLPPTAKSAAPARSGAIFWNGELQKNQLVILDGRLPGVPVSIAVDTQDYAIFEAPSPSNNWNRIVIRSRFKGHAVIRIQWSAL